jgi:L-ascorbate metabolism protein UlaG (beta-lactamase superfamily)
MTRRQFIRNFLITFKSLAMMSMLPKTSWASVSADYDNGSLHYTPLNGRSLRDIAKEKLHHNSGGFVNPLGLGRDGRFWEVMKWKLFSNNQFKGFFDEEQVTPVSIDWEQIRQHRGCSVTFVKHASVMIKDDDRYILVDPVFSDIFWFIKDFSPLEFDLKTMPAPEHVLITHGHYDHLDKPSLASLDKDTHVITPLGYNQIFRDLTMNNRTQLDWFESYDDGEQKITFLPCNHWTMRNPLTGPNRSLWGSYMIRTSGGYTIYISGDTAYFDGYEQLGKEFDIDLAVFNVGAYEPRWFMAPSHMNPRETVEAFKKLNARKLLIVHWGTFRLGDEPVHFPPMQVKEELEKEGLLDRLVDLKHGETMFLDSNGSVRV